MSRTFLSAHAAIFTFYRVDHSVIVFDLDCVKLASLFTLLAADAAGLTGLSRDGSFVGGTACDVSQAAFGNHFDQIVWTCFGTCFAADAVVSVHPCDTVYDADRVEIAGGHAIAKTKAAVAAGADAAVKRFDRFTGRNALIFENLICFRIVTAAHNDSVLSFTGIGLDAHDRGESRTYGRAADRAEGNSRAVFYDGVRIIGAAGKSAAAAVCAGQGFCKKFDSFIDRYVHDFSGNRQENACDNTYDTYEYDRNKISHIFNTSLTEYAFYDAAEPHKGYRQNRCGDQHGRDALEYFRDIGVFHLAADSCKENHRHQESDAGAERVSDS